MLFSRPILTSAQLDRLSNILDNMGQGIFVVLVLTPFVQGIDKTGVPLLVLGVVDVASCWIGSLILARDKDI